MGAIFVTGATGFLGGALVHRFAAEGADVFATGRDPVKLAQLPLREDRRLALDLAKSVPDEVLTRLRDLTAIVQCTGLASAWGRSAEFERANVVATENVIALARVLGVNHLVHISSPSIYFRFEDQLNVAEGMLLPKPVNA